MGVLPVFVTIYIYMATEYQKRRYQENKERLKAKSKAWAEANRAKSSIIAKRYADANKAKRNERVRRSKDNDPSVRLIHNIRARHREVLKGRQSTTKGLGCDREFLRDHIENQFTEGMSWDNYGKGEGKWTLDHIIPLDLIKTNPELTAQIIHYTNFQPLWYLDNIKKGKKL